MTNHDDRDDERDWPDDDVNYPANSDSSQRSEQLEPEDDAAPLPVRHPTRRRQTQRHRSRYRPPSELDSD